MSRFILKKKLFTTDIQGAENELQNLRNILSKTDPSSPKYQTLQQNLRAREQSLNQMRAASSNLPAKPVATPKPPTAAASTAPSTAKNSTGFFKNAWNNMGKAGRIGTVAGGAILTGLAIKGLAGGKKQEQQKTYSIKRVTK